MCGICGFTGAPDPETLAAMTASLHHRGPDEAGFHADARVSLGVRRLSIIDPATGHQPIASEDGSVWTALNGEIYNAAELRAGLERAGHRSRTDHTDTEVIVHLYEEHGDEFPRLMNGMFAIAVWDAAAGRLLLVRDRMGVKPLYYAELPGGRLVFGSEIKALLRHPACPREMDPVGLYHYFTFKNVPAPWTAFRGVRVLGAGERLAWAGGRAERARWWRARFSVEEDATAEAAAGRVAALLEDATRMRMVSDVPIGAYLSGGIDSSAVVALMSRHSARPVKTFALGYVDGPAGKEADLVHARRVAELFRTEHHEHLMSWRDLEAELGEVIGAFDQPFSGTVSTYFLTGLIGRHVKVALSGDGADELFGSYLTHRVAQPLAHYRGLAARARAGQLTGEERDLLRPCDPEFLDRLLEASGGEEAAWRCRLALFDDETKRTFLTPGFLAGAGGASSLGLVREAFSGLTGRDPLNRVLEMEWNTQLPDQCLAFVDLLSMAHSVEIRSPFLDVRLVELVAGLPGGLKIRGGVTKDLLRRSVAHLLPREVVERPKEGFVLPVFSWLERELEPLCRGTLAPGRVARHEVLDPSWVGDYVAGFYAGDRARAAGVWNLLVFQLWCERYF